MIAARDVTRNKVFTGFSPAALKLLAGLKRNNDRAWFAERKERITAELIEPVRLLVDDASAALERAKIPIRGDRKRSVFRIYRDVRFSPDKSPYKTHVSAYLSYDGGRDTPGGIYVHVEPGASMLAVAFYLIEAPMLARWRREMAERPARFMRVVGALAKRGLTIDGPDAWDDSLKRMPRGFEAYAESELAPYFRLRSFCARRMLSDAEVATPKLIDAIVAIARDAKPLLDFGWSLD
jgi:uncharacterized protein (TIGR02453 family)